MITTLLTTVIGAGLLAGLIHLLIVLIVIAIIYYIGAAIIGALAPATGAAMISKLWLVLCALIALYFVVIFLLTLAP